MTQIILGSGSKRRTEILDRAGITHSIHKPSDAQEEHWSHTWAYSSPRALVRRLSILKATLVASEIAGLNKFAEASPIIVSADTVVEFNGQTLGKPTSDEAAIAMLTQLRGKQHAILTGVTIFQPKTGQLRSTVAETIAEMDSISDQFIEDYVKAGFAHGKAGAYGIQDAMLTGKIKLISGDFDNVVGLPMRETLRLLQEFPTSR